MRADAMCGDHPARSHARGRRLVEGKAASALGYLPRGERRQQGRYRVCRGGAAAGAAAAHWRRRRL
eukprot:973747-Pyramimonas_sp.AAC.2